MAKSRDRGDFVATVLETESTFLISVFFYFKILSNDIIINCLQCSRVSILQGRMRVRSATPPQVCLSITGFIYYGTPNHRHRVTVERPDIVANMPDSLASTRASISGFVMLQFDTEPKHRQPGNARTNSICYYLSLPPHAFPNSRTS